jgi:hypothetical protein
MNSSGVSVFQGLLVEDSIFAEVLAEVQEDAIVVLFRFEFKSIGARNNGLELLERNGFDYGLVEDLRAMWSSYPSSPSMRRS